MTIPSKENIEINRRAIEHRAAWMGLTYQAAKEMGAEAELITRRGISYTADMHGNNYKKICGADCDMKLFRESFVNTLVEHTFEMDIKTCSDDTLEIEFHYCPLVEGWKKAGLDEADIPLLCDMAMDGDRGIAKILGLEFTLGKTIADGDAICEVCFKKKPAKAL